MKTRYLAINEDGDLDTYEWPESQTLGDVMEENDLDIPEESTCSDAWMIELEIKHGKPCITNTKYIWLPDGLQDQLEFKDEWEEGEIEQEKEE